MVVDNLPVGTYTARIKRPGWPDYSEVVNIQPNAFTIVEHSFKGIQVTLQSDPAGATIYLGSSELGKTPMTAELPPGRVQLVSRIGALAPVTQEFVPGRDGKQVIEFKHDYGIVSISSDRPNSVVSIAGVDLGKLPIEAILPPGQHQVVVHCEGLPDQSKTVDVRAGQKVSMQASFTTTSGVAATLTLRPETPDEENAQPTPKPARPKTPRAEQTPTYRTKEDYERAKDAAYRRFDDEWEARKNALKRQRDYYDYQIDHSEGAAKEKWKAKKEEIERRLDQLDDQKDNAKSVLKRQWND
jgi:hypothetical protein